MCYTHLVPAKFSFRDPEAIPHSNGHVGAEQNLGQVGNWSTLERQTMEARFAAAMTRAGYPITVPSTVFGTRSPVANYQRD